MAAKKAMTKDQIISYFKDRQDVFNISAISRKAGVPGLYAAINGLPDGHGRPATLADHHMEPLIKVIKSMQMYVVTSR